MRILVNARFLIPDKLEGIGYYTYEIISRIAQAHPDHEFFLCVDRKAGKSFRFTENVHFELIYPMARHPFLFIWWFEVGIPKAYQKLKADLFYSPDGFLSLAPEVRKNLLVIHDLAYLHYPQQISKTMLWYYKKYMPSFVTRANQIITVSQTTLTDLDTHFPSSRGKTSVIYNGTREFPQKLTQQPHLSQPGTEKPYFISIGSIHPRKNTIGLLEAFEKVKELQHDVNLIIIGRKAWKTSEIESTYAACKFKESIFFTGYLSDQEMFRYLANSLALVYVSYFEGFGLPIVDAMKAGVPVITSNRSSMEEIAGNAALLVDPGSNSQIASAMMSIVEDPDLRQKLIVEGLKRAQLFNWNQAAEAVWNIMKAMTLE